MTTTLWRPSEHQSIIITEMPPKKQQPLIINKKLIIHFQLSSLIFQRSSLAIDQKLALMFVKFAWGRVEQKDQKGPAVWKLIQNHISVARPEDLISYYQYLEEKYVEENQDQQAIDSAVANFMKPGNPGLKLKTQFDKATKALYLSKAQVDAVRSQNDSKQDSSKDFKDLCNRLIQGKFQILPHFFKLMINLRKHKKQFAIILHYNQPIPEIIYQINLFCNGEHPLYNGKNGTPQVKFDGSKGCKNYVIGPGCVSFGEQGCVFGTNQVRKGENSLKQRYPQEGLRVCQGAGQSYVGLRQHLKQTCSLSVKHSNPQHFSFVTDKVDYNTQQIFICKQETTLIGLDAISNKPFDLVPNLDLYRLDELVLVKDSQIFIKAIEEAGKLRHQEIEKMEKGKYPVNDKLKEWQEFQALPPIQYLNRAIVPLLVPGLQRLDKERPEQPLLFLAMHCFKNKKNIRIPEAVEIPAQAKIPQKEQ